MIVPTATGTKIGGYVRIGDNTARNSEGCAHSRSMSPMRGDVKEKFFPLPLRGEIDVATCIQPDLRSEEALGS